MKIEFIKRGAETRLILIFAGWSTDSRYYIDCVADGWDTAVVSDYRDLSMPQLPEQYSTIYIFAYSLGVWAAANSKLHAAARIAICGTPIPASDEFGIPENVFMGTADGLDTRSLMKFHLRMAGDKSSYSRISPLLPSSPDIDLLKQELYLIASQAEVDVPLCRWHRAYIADSDRIFPSPNQIRFWSGYDGVEKIILHSSHAANIVEIVKQCLPNLQGIGEGFGKAVATYNENAIIQTDVCERIGKKLKDISCGVKGKVNSVLEIGVGNGLLTDIWRQIFTVERVDFVDLIEMKRFGIADYERYIIADAEQWLESSSDKYDLILSSSAIQWFADPVNFIKTVRSHLNPGGTAIISTFVKGNLRELDEVRLSPIIYRSVEEYNEIPDVEIEEWERTLFFPTMREMLMHLRLTGVSPRRKSPPTAKINVLHVKNMSSLSPQLTYHPLIITITA